MAYDGVTNWMDKNWQKQLYCLLTTWAFLFAVNLKQVLSLIKTRFALPCNRYCVGGVQTGDNEFDLLRNFHFQSQGLCFVSQCNFSTRYTVGLQHLGVKKKVGQITCYFFNLNQVVCLWIFSLTKHQRIGRVVSQLEQKSYNMQIIE